MRRLFLCLPVFLLATQLLLAQTSLYRVDTIAGGTVAGDGGAATSALLIQAQGLALDSKHRLYIADASDNRVRRIDADGTIETIAGTGLAGSRGDGWWATQAELRNPYGLAIDSQDNLYIADLGNSKIRKVTASGIITTLAGGGMVVPGGTNDGGPGTDYLLGAPRNLTFDPQGHLFVSDFSRNQVYEVSPDGTLVTAAGTGTAGHSGDFGAAQLAELDAPAGLTLLPDGSLLICDSGNNVIRRVVGDTIQTYLPSTGLQPGVALVAPTGLAYNPGGLLLVADSQAGGIVSIDVRSGSTQVFASGSDLTIDSSLNLFLSQGGFVSEISATGQTSSLAGSSNNGFFGEGVKALNARLNEPAGVTADTVGNIYFADRQTNRIRHIRPDGFITTFAGTGIPGYSGDGGTAGSAQLNQPSSVSIDVSSNVLVADTGNHAIRLISPMGMISTVAGTGTPGAATDGSPAAGQPLNAPEFAIANGLQIYISDSGNHTVWAIDAQGLIHRVAGSGSSGSSGDGLPAVTATLESPRGLAFDAQGNLYIADEAAGVIRMVNSSGIMSTVTSAATGPWVSPSGLAMLGDGSLVVSDYGTHEIRALHKNGTATVLGGTGSAGFSGDTSLAVSGQFDAPVGLFVTNDGSLLVADTGNNRIRSLTLRPPTVPPNSRFVSVVNAASRLPGPVAPGEIASVIGNVTTANETLTASSGLPTLPLFLGETEVMINGQPVPLISIQPRQINLQIPYGISGAQSALLQVLFQGEVVATETIKIAPSRPGLYLSAGSRTQVLAKLQDGTFNSRSNPVLAGDTLSLFITGDGLTDGSNQSGVTVTAVSHPVLPVKLTLDGKNVAIQTAAEVIGTEGLLQVTFAVPSSTTSGEHAVHLIVGSAGTQPFTQIWVAAKTNP